MGRLQGKRALVFGASAGIGKAISEALVREGGAVVMVARTPATLDAAAKAAGGMPIAADVSSAEDIARLKRQAIERLGGLDILVISSGIFVRGPITELTPEIFAQTMQVNVGGPLDAIRSFAPDLIESGGDLLVVNSTITRAANLAGRSLFAAGNHALKALTDGLRDELNPLNVRVTSLFPGTTATPRQEAAAAADGRDYAPDRLLQPEDVAEIAIAALCLPPTAEATDLYVRPRYKS